jgi:hypothetical protein
MRKPQATTSAPRRWSPRPPTAARRGGPPASAPRLPFAGGHGRAQTRSAGLSALRPGRQPARRSRRGGQTSPMSLARGVLGAFGGNMATKRGKASGKAPVWLALLGGLGAAGAAGAAALKRRQGTQQPPHATDAPPAPAGGTDPPPVEAA